MSIDLHTDDFIMTIVSNGTKVSYREEKRYDTAGMSKEVI